MLWQVTLKGIRVDIDRLLASPTAAVSATSEPTHLLVEITDETYASHSDDARQAGRALVEAAVQRINDFGALRWGRAFERLSIDNVTALDETGRAQQVVFGGRAYHHMLPEDYADMVENLGRPRPPLPVGLDDVNALDLTEIDSLAASEPDVGRVLRLVARMLEGDDDIDWAAGYAVLEVIERYAYREGHQLNSLGFCTQKEFEVFNHMANSRLAVGLLSRHQGREYNPPSKLLSAKDASWLVRRVTARWITWLRAGKPPPSS